jgi:hypothetical protein
LEHVLFFHIFRIIILTDELIFVKMVIAPPTRTPYYQTLLFRRYLDPQGIIPYHHQLIFFKMVIAPPTSII